jgi:putative transposase
MTKLEDRAIVKVAKEALLTDRDGLKELFRGVLQEVLEAEMAEAVGAGKGERTEGRLGYRSGYYTRGLVTRLERLHC